MRDPSASHNSSRTPWAWLNGWPVRRVHQALFAEAFQQTLCSGMDISTAICVAAQATPGARFRAALREMATHCRAGHTLADALRRTGIRVSGELLAALAIGEQRGDLAGALAGFARQSLGDPRRRLANAVHRRPEAIRFAAALARWLRDQRLTVELVEDAGRLAAADNSAFAEAIRRVADSMRSGNSFSMALHDEPLCFDRLFCTQVGVPAGRDQLRTVLARLGECDDG